MEDIITRLVDDLPGSVRGMTIRDANGDYNIYLNAKLSYEELQTVYRHELAHITGHDFDREGPVSAIEEACEDRADQDSGTPNTP